MESDNEVISRLKFISKIQKGEKINVKYMFVQPEGIITRLSRTLYYHCNRTNTLNFITNTIRATLQIISRCRKSDTDHLLCKNIITDLQESKKGIVNLKNTYIDDLKIGCDLDTVLQEIDSFLSSLEKVKN